MTDTTETFERLAAPLYLVAALLVVIPGLDFASGVLPLRVDNIEWRFATVGLLSGFVLTPFLGITVAMIVAGSQGHGLVLRVLGVTTLVLAVMLGLVLGGFVLDIVQLRNAVSPEAQTAFQSAAWRAIAKHGAFVVALGWLGRRAMGELTRATYMVRRRSVAGARA